MRVDILTLFPEIIHAYLKESIMKRAIGIGAIEVNVINFREYTTNKHGRVDDYPYGGGPGLLLMIQPIYDALNALPDKNRKVILTSPAGTPFTQKVAQRLKDEEHLVIICGHYEGVDHRVTEYLVDEEISIGDYVLTGGELAALVILDAVTRLLPNVLNKEESHQTDSFSMRLLEYPQYTRPRDFKGMKVPDVLLSGDHGKIARYRKKEALRRTYLKRPDLLENYPFTEEELALLQEVIKEESKDEK
ncbi:MAG TPA: tRNA (guanosine(37)-N1)-methyltransferase TrmD [Haloplasmataceae bacterium]